MSRTLSRLLVTVLSAAALILPVLPATAAAALAPAIADTATAVDRRPPMTNDERPSFSGTPREGRWLRAEPGRWTPNRTETRFRWLRDGRPILGARHRSYRLGWRDVGRRVRVEVRVRRAGHAWTSASSRPTRPVGYRSPVRRRVTYHVETRGRITTSVRTFARLAQQTFDDPRGWRAGGVEFRRVARGGDVSLVLAEASRVDDFSPVCSTQWSCRVGRFVVINQERWKHASPAWNAGRGTLRGYRHMVVNHETGHWLGRGHRDCPGRGRAAPVMMQQSIDLGGCRFNPWPLPGER